MHRGVAARGALSSTRSNSHCVGHTSFSMSPAECWSHILPTQLHPSSAPLFLRIRIMWFCTAFLPFSIKDSKCNIKHFHSYCFFHPFFPYLYSTFLLFFFPQVKPVLSSSVSQQESKVKLQSVSNGCTVHRVCRAEPHFYMNFFYYRLYIKVLNATT